MRAYMWAAALVVVLGFGLRAPAAPIVVTGNASTLQTSTSAFFKPLTVTSFLISPSKLASFFPAMPSIANISSTSMSVPVPMKNGTPTAAFMIQTFGIAPVTRAQ